MKKKYPIILMILIGFMLSAPAMAADTGETINSADVRFFKDGVKIDYTERLSGVRSNSDCIRLSHITKVAYDKSLFRISITLFRGETYHYTFKSAYSSASAYKRICEGAFKGDYPTLRY